MHVVFFESDCDYRSLSIFNQDGLSWSIAFSIKGILNAFLNKGIASNKVWMCSHCYILSDSNDVVLNNGNDSIKNAISSKMIIPVMVRLIFDSMFTITTLMKYQRFDLLIQLIQIGTLLPESYNLNKLLNIKSKRDNEYTNKESGSVMSQLTDLYVTLNDTRI